MGTVPSFVNVQGYEGAASWPPPPSQRSAAASPTKRLNPRGNWKGSLENKTSCLDGSPSDGVMGCAELSLSLTQYSVLLEH